MKDPRQSELRDTVEATLAQFPDLPEDSRAILDHILALNVETRRRAAEQQPSREKFFQIMNSRAEDLASFKRGNRTQGIDDSGPGNMVRLSTLEETKRFGLLPKTRQLENITLRKNGKSTVFDVDRRTEFIPIMDSALGGRPGIKVSAKGQDPSKTISESTAKLPFGWEDTQSAINISRGLEDTQGEVVSILPRFLLPNITFRVRNLEGATLPQLLRDFKTRMDEAVGNITLM